MEEEKATGLRFAEQQLLRHGWEKGKGLGRRENGIQEAIKVKIKCDKGGMGHKEGEQFTFHWWDHVFNKASSSLVVETQQDGVMMKAADDSNNGLISNKKPRKAQLAKSMLYGSFVKSATLLSGKKHTEKHSDSDESSSSSEDEDQKLDLSSTTKLSDADLLKACGGRTAHKGARHGLTMNAKLARLEQQEQEFMNKYGKKNKTLGSCSSSQACNDVTSMIPEDNTDSTERTRRRKSKKKDTSKNDICDDKTTREDSNAFLNDTMTDAEPRKRKKRNRKDKATSEESLNGDCRLAERETSSRTSNEAHQDSSEISSCISIDKSVTKKKKKKQRLIADVISEDISEMHSQEGLSELQETSDNVSKKKRKKKMAITEGTKQKN